MHGIRGDASDAIRGLTDFGWMENKGVMEPNDSKLCGGVFDKTFNRTTKRGSLRVPSL